jgi:hypothetical protein
LVINTWDFIAVRESGDGKVSLRATRLSAGRTPESHPVQKDENAGRVSPYRPFGQGPPLPSGRCASAAPGATMQRMDVIGVLALFLMAFVLIGRSPDGRD